MRVMAFFVVTAALESGTGLALLAFPAIPLDLLLGFSGAGPEAALVARIAGAALLALGVASWAARAAGPNPARRGLLVGLFLYDGLAAGLLASAAPGGLALWPAVALHTALAGWCVACLRGEPRGAGRER